MKRTLVLSTIVALMGCSGSQPEGSDKSNLRPITSLVGRDYRIDIYSSQRGPIYSVKDLEGNVLAEGTSPAAIRAEKPELFEKVRDLLATFEQNEVEIWAHRDTEQRAADGPRAGSSRGVPLPVER